MAYQTDQPSKSRRVIKYADKNAYVELIRQDMYHRKLIPASTSSITSFFKDITSTTLLDTNMTTSGMLPTPQAYSIYGISAFVQQGLDETNFAKLMNESAIELRLSNKPYLQIPFHSIPAGGGLYGMAATTENATRIFQAQNGIPAPNNFLPVDIDGEPIHLISQQDFVCVLQTFNAVAFSVPFFVTVHLVGVLYRPVL